MKNAEWRESRKIWKGLNKKQSRLIPSKSERWNFLFWVSLFLFSVFSTVLSILNLFLTRGQAQVFYLEEGKRILIGTWTWFERTGYANSNTNKIIQFLLSLTSFGYSIFLFSRIIRSGWSIVNGKIIIFVMVLNVLYSVANLPIYFENIKTNKQLIEEFFLDVEFTISDSNVDNYQLVHSFASFYMNYYFYFELSAISIPVIMSIAFLLLWAFSNKTDTMIIN